jgi:hypothetical protein
MDRGRRISEYAPRSKHAGGGEGRAGVGRRNRLPWSGRGSRNLRPAPEALTSTESRLICRTPKMSARVAAGPRSYGRNRAPAARLMKTKCCGASSSLPMVCSLTSSFRRASVNASMAGAQSLESASFGPRTARRCPACQPRHEGSRRTARRWRSGGAAKFGVQVHRPRVAVLYRALSKGQSL